MAGYFRIVILKILHPVNRVPFLSVLIHVQNIGCPIDLGHAGNGAGLGEVEVGRDFDMQDAAGHVDGDVAIA